MGKPANSVTSKRLTLHRRQALIGCGFTQIMPTISAAAAGLGMPINQRFSTLPIVVLNKTGLGGSRRNR